MPTLSRRSSWSSAFVLLGAVCGFVLLSDVAQAQVQRIHKPKSARTFATHEYVPMYPGDNELRVRGPAVHTADAIELPPGIAEVVRLQSKVPHPRGIGELAAFIRVKPMVHGKITVRVTYPDDAQSDTFNARVYRRGTVQALSAPPKAQVGSTIRVLYTGRGFGIAALRAGGALYSVKRRGGSDRSADFDVIFKQCGTLWAGPDLLHDAEVPYSEVVSGEAGYLGTVRSTIVVGPAAGKECPAIEPNRPEHLPFCRPGKRWDPNKRDCTARSIITERVLRTGQ